MKPVISVENRSDSKNYAIMIWSDILETYHPPLWKIPGFRTDLCGTNFSWTNFQMQHKIITRGDLIHFFAYLISEQLQIGYQKW